MLLGRYLVGRLVGWLVGKLLVRVLGLGLGLGLGLMDYFFFNKIYKLELDEGF